MSALSRLRPWSLGALALAIAAWLVHSALRLQRENEALRSEPAPSAIVVAQPAPAPAESKPGAISLDELRAETKREVELRTAAEARIAELQKRLPTKDGEVLVSFGRIDQMGQRAGKVMRFLIDEAMRAQAGSGASNAQLPEAERQEQTKAFTEFISQVGELRALEDEPREIARFHTAVLRDVLGFDDATAQRTTAMLEREFAQLQTQQLTARHRPEKDPAEWDGRRDAAVTEMAARLRPLLSGNATQLKLLPGILNMGGGTRTEVKVGPTGDGTVIMKLPLFPDLKL